MKNINAGKKFTKNLNFESRMDGYRIWSYKARVLIIYASGCISLHTSTSSYSIKRTPSCRLLYIYIKHRVVCIWAFIIFETNECKGNEKQRNVDVVPGSTYDWISMCERARVFIVRVCGVCSYVTVTHAGGPAAMIGEASRRGCQGNDHFSLPSMGAVTPSTLNSICVLCYAQSLRCQAKCIKCNGHKLYNLNTRMR